MIKLHLFSGFENERLGIQRDTPLGHLYSDQSTDELLAAARLIGIYPARLQNSRGFIHLDLWGEPLTKARQQFKIVTNREIYQDMRGRRSPPS